MDYCTFFPDMNFSHCCEAHDLAYASIDNKFISDIELFSCVLQSAPEGMGFMYGAISVIMFSGVSIFGIFFYAKAAIIKIIKDKKDGRTKNTRS